jgi:hypothetical protein
VNDEEIPDKEQNHLTKRRLPSTLPTRAQRRQFLIRRIIDKEGGRLMMMEGGSSTMREGVNEEIADAEGQNTFMMLVYSMLEQSSSYNSVTFTIKFQC